MMKNITTTTNTINKNTPSLRERTHELLHNVFSWLILLIYGIHRIDQMEDATACMHLHYLLMLKNVHIWWMVEVQQQQLICVSKKLIVNL